MIELKSVEKIYSHEGQTVKALEGINLKIPEACIFGIIGKSGAGKSTLLRCMNLLESPTQGEVWMGDLRLDTLTDAPLRAARRRIGMIFQHFHLLNSKTVFENIALPLQILGESKQYIRTRVLELLALVGLEDKQTAYPRQLSGGQKQRVAIARALVTSPEVLLCDEATSSLDVETTASILSLLKEIHQRLGITIVLITHEMDVIKQICDEVAVLDQGRIIEQKDVLTLFTRPETDLAKRLTARALHLELPSSIRHNLRSTPDASSFPVIRVSFVGDQSRKPLLAELMEKYQVASSILLADIETIQDVTIGVSICQLRGAPSSVSAALDHLKGQLQVEVLGYAQ